MKHVNYDQIANKYNQRYQVNPLAGVENALLQLIKDSSAKTILEVGCGTGFWLEGLANRVSAVQLSGLDYSQGMLNQAQERGTTANLVQGMGGQLPFQEAAFDLVFCVNALHHFNQPVNFINRAKELLKPGGTLSVIGQVPHDKRNQWFVYEYFEGTYANDLQRFPTWGTIMDWMMSAGFCQIHWEPVEWISDDKYGEEVLDDPFLQKHAVSQLAMLSESSYGAGIDRIKADLKKAKGSRQTLVFKSQLRLDMLSGNIPKDKLDV